METPLKSDPSKKSNEIIPSPHSQRHHLDFAVAVGQPAEQPDSYYLPTRTLARTASTLRRLAGSSCVVSARLRGCVGVGRLRRCCRRSCRTFGGSWTLRLVLGLRKDGLFVLFLFSPLVWVPFTKRRKNLHFELESQATVEGAELEGC